jgi:hypothetical protein
MRRERLTVEKLGADCIDIRMLNRAHLFAGEAQRCGSDCGGRAYRA